MDPTGQTKQPESAGSSRARLRSGAAPSSWEGSSMGQNASTNLLGPSSVSMMDAPTSCEATSDISPEKNRKSSSQPSICDRSSAVHRSNLSLLSKDPAADRSTDRKASTIAHSETDCLCPTCGNSLENSSSKENVDVRHLWQTHLKMIDQQRATMLERDSEVQELRQTNKQLETKLKRLERQLAISSTFERTLSNSRDDELQAPSSSSMHAKLRSSSRVGAKRSSSYGSAINSAMSSSPPTSPPAQKVCKRVEPSPGFMVTNIMYDTPTHAQFPSALCRENEPEADRGAVVSTPSWRIVEDESKAPGAILRGRSSGSKDVENLSDETFLQRHYKYEQEEKRIKRWDLQRARTQREHEKLRKRYEEKEDRWHNQPQGETHEVINSFLPPLDQLKEIEFTDDLPVTAFGKVVPALARTEFSLPWFDPVKHPTAAAADAEARKTRSRARGGKA